MANFGDRQGNGFTVRPGRAKVKANDRPFWLPASNYYVLAAGISAGFFFLVWGFLNDGEETPWVTAGVSASLLLCGAVILREVILRRSRNRILLQQRNFDLRVRGLNQRKTDNQHPTKLTLERNAAIINEIGKKSEAAKVLNKLSSGHREVFEICREYLNRNENELKTVAAGSPRLGALLKGRSTVANYHRYHLLRWAEIEARSLTNDAQSLPDISEKIEAAQNAINVIDSALTFYPAEVSLTQSRELINELLVSIKVSHWVEQAERAAFKGEYREARNHYRDALFYLGRDNVQTYEREQAAERINEEIQRLMESENRG